MTDYRALCARMADELDHYRQLLMDDRREAHALATEARALLAQPVAESPADEELDEFALFWWGSDTDERTVTDVIECCSMAAYARAVLAKWGANAQ